MAHGLTFDGITHFPVAAPASGAELGDLVRSARAANQALYPFGGGTMLDLGLSPIKPGTAVDLRPLDGVIDYPARDMTVTVQAGIGVEKLQQMLLVERQRLAVDVPLADRATLGGAIAANASGPRRFGLGTLRDYVIGISVVNDEGQEVKAGGRVVKNVAGYDLMKLYTGALGTLGIITQVTLKLKPLPESSRLVVLPVPFDDVAVVLDVIQSTATRPTCIELLDPGASMAISEKRSIEALTKQWNVVIGYEGNAPAVAWQVERIREEIPAGLRSGLRECSADEALKLWTALADFTLWPEMGYSFKANMTPSAVLDFCRHATLSEPTPMLRAHAGNGIVHGHSEGLSLEGAQSMLERLGMLAAQAHGNIIVTRCPPAWKPLIPVWGRSTGDRAMMKAVKEKLDPAGIFNPGRFVDGI
jgi:glycolate oxidase FAD binding subunit